MTLRTPSFLAVVAAAVLVPLATTRLAHADAVPPDAYACDPSAAPGHFDSSKVGSACKLSTGESGVCQRSTCSGFDYSKWDRDASASPPSVQFDCSKCVASASSSSSGGTSSSSGDAGPSASSSGSSASSDGGCSVARTRPLRAAAPWVVALIVPALSLLGRKRKDRSRP